MSLCNFRQQAHQFPVERIGYKEKRYMCTLCSFEKWDSSHLRYLITGLIS